METSKTSRQGLICIQLVIDLGVLEVVLDYLTDRRDARRSTYQNDILYLLKSDLGVLKACFNDRYDSVEVLLIELFKETFQRQYAVRYGVVLETR